jgi:hypothetical protein
MKNVIAMVDPAALPKADHAGNAQHGQQKVFTVHALNKLAAPLSFAFYLLGAVVVCAVVVVLLLVSSILPPAAKAPVRADRGRSRRRPGTCAQLDGNRVDRGDARWRISVVAESPSSSPSPTPPAGTDRRTATRAPQEVLSDF